MGRTLMHRLDHPVHRLLLLLHARSPHAPSASSLAMHGLETNARQVLVPLAAGITPNTDATEDHAILHNHQPSLSKGELGVTHLANASPLTVQPLGVGSGIQAQDG